MVKLNYSIADDLVVSTDGRIFLPDGTEKHQYLVHGYPCIKYHQMCLRVHRVVAQRFIPNPENKSDVNHIDGIKTNNHITNLEWMTRTENLYHSLRNGLHDEEEMPVRAINKLTGAHLDFISMSEAARQLKTWQPNIWKVIHGKRKSAGGYYWEKIIA